MNKFPRGSEWRKWDLQVQPIKNCWFTKFIENKGCIKSATEEYIKNAIEKKISVIAITDHNTGFAIDVALEIIKEKSLNLTVLPGVEIDFNTGFQMLVVFNPNFKEKINKSSWNDTVEYFLNHNCSLPSPVFSDDLQANSISKDINEILKDICNQDIGIAFFAHSQSVKGIFRTTSPANRKEFFERMRNGDFYFGIDHKTSEEINKTINILNGWNLIENDYSYPLIITSDAHSASEVGNNFTWIKADPTYEGLKQIIYEPKERIKNQPDEPEDKKQYRVISSIQLVSSDNFWHDNILLNKNLNVIIGGRSSGKSNLLKTIGVLANQIDLSDKYLEDQIKNSVVTWGDGEQKEKRDIEYYPQNHLINIAEDYKSENKSNNLNKLIDDILVSNELYGKIEQYKKFLIENSNKVEALINDLYLVNNKIFSLEDEIKSIGDIIGIKSEITKLESEKDSISSTFNFSEDERKVFSEMVSKLNTLDNDLRITKMDLDLLENSAGIADGFINKQNIESFLSLFNYREELSDKFLFILSETTKKFSRVIEENKQNLKQKLSTIRNEKSIIENDALFLKGQDAIKNNSQLTKIEESLKNENKKINLLDIKNKEKEKSIKKYEELLDNVIKLNKNFRDKVIALSKDVIIETNGISIKIIYGLDKKGLRVKLENFINLQTSESKNLITTFCDDYCEGSAIIKDFIEKCLNDKIPLKSGNKSIDLLKNILTNNHYSSDYVIVFNNDEFSEMSPGKKAFIVLQLLLEFSKKTCPILIDQPEDSLDNRAIYKELATYLKNKKQERQIILVSHNANIAVNSDAECIIVANRHDAKTPNENGTKFKYISGSLENTQEYIDDEDTPILYRQGIREHVCEILEGGEMAFNKRKNKYNFSGKH